MWDSITGPWESYVGQYNGSMGELHVGQYNGSMGELCGTV